VKALRVRQIALALVDHIWSPRPKQLFERFDPITTDFTYVRWIGDRKAIEQETKTWDRVIVVRSADLAEWVEVLKTVHRRKIQKAPRFEGTARIVPNSVKLGSTISALLISGKTPCLISLQETHTLNDSTALLLYPAMDRPHCKTRNSIGAVNCSNCRAPLGGNAATLVGVLTPPTWSSGGALDGQAQTPPRDAGETTVDGSAPSSMAIPTAWSVSGSGQGNAGGGASRVPR
jgi:hypothetical protein